MSVDFSRECDEISIEILPSNPSFFHCEGEADSGLMILILQPST